METLKASTHAKAHYMFFIQAVYNVICGVYPVDAEEAVQLAALQVLQKFGPHKPDVCVAGPGRVFPLRQCTLACDATHSQASPQ